MAECRTETKDSLAFAAFVTKRPIVTHITAIAAAATPAHSPCGSRTTATWPTDRRIHPAVRYRSSAGNVYARESNHWDITYCGGSSACTSAASS